jgi:protein-tyrosine phosphatase
LRLDSLVVAAGTLPVVERTGPYRVLVVCTANVCRSPMGAGLLAARAAERGLELQVTSAGTRAAGLPVDPMAVRAAADLGVDIAAHEPRRITTAIVADEGTDLVLTMTRGHLRDVAVMGRQTFARTFTLREAVRRLQGISRMPGLDLPARVAAAAEGRRPADLMRDDPNDDVADPYGTGQAAVSRTAGEIDRLVHELLTHLHRP